MIEIAAFLVDFFEQLKHVGDPVPLLGVKFQLSDRLICDVLCDTIKLSDGRCNLKVFSYTKPISFLIEVRLLGHDDFVVTLSHH